MQKLSRYLMCLYFLVILPSLAFGQTPLVSTLVNEALKEQLNSEGKWVTVEMADGTSFSTAPLGGDVVGPSASVDSEIAIYNSTTGKLLKRFAGTGIVKAVGGVIGTATAGDFPTLNQNTTGNAATVTTNANLTGHVTSTGNAAVLGSFTSANLAGALSDETGSGVAVFGTSPTFTTQITTPSIISVGALGITPASGSNLNINLAGTGDLAVNTNQFYVDAGTGFVGIGTTVPTAKLQVISTTNSGWATIVDNSGTTDAHGLYANIGALSTGIPFRVDKGNTGLFQILNNGNVGIGTLSPIYKLSVNGTFGTYESYTDASNYSALKLSADSAGLKFIADQLGTGIANRPFVFLQTSSATGTGWDLQTGTGTSKVKWDVSGKQYDGVIGDSSASPGNATLNTVSGKSAIAAGQTAMTLTNSNIATTSMIFISPLDVDATALSFKHSVSAGVGTITVNAAATAAWKFSWKVIN